VLKTLVIKNFIIVDYQEIELQPGFNIVTGETGTGKSLLVNALLFLLGGRYREEWIRQGKDVASVEGCFDLEKHIDLWETLQSLGIPTDIPKKIVVSREITKAGKSKTRLNGRTVPLQILKTVASLLIDVYAQGDQIRFLNQENKIHILDTFLSAQGRETKEKYHALFGEIQSLRERVKALNQGQEQHIAEYQAILQEMEEAKIDPQRVEAIEEEFRRLSSSQGYLEVIHALLSLLWEEEGFLARLARIKGTLRNLPDEFPFFSPPSVLETLERVEVDLYELANHVQRAREAFSFSPERIEELEREIGEIERLKRKYRLLTTRQLLAFREEVMEELKRREQEAEERNMFLQREETLMRELTALGRSLSVERAKAAQTFRQAMEEAMKDLAFRQVEFIPLLEQCNEPQEYGFDRVSFLVSLNPGELPQPVEDIASGGELSRIILAMKSIAPSLQSVPTLIFDEIDQGIGGKTAFWVGSKLKRLARHHQVICITHLPQIAAFADHHLKVEKWTDAEKTWTQVAYLRERGERIEELARMMGDEEHNLSALQYAEILLEKVNNGDH